MKKIFSYFIYWLLQCTWGIIMTLIGGIGALIMLISGHKPHKFGPNVYFEIGESWGGVSFGPFFFCSKDSDLDLKYHEAGHGLQNIILGPLFPFIVAIPSALRYHLREKPTHLKKSLFNLFFLLIALLLTTGLACITGLILSIKWLTILLECFRLYFLIASIWLTLFEIPKYNVGYVEYDAIWFEGWATHWGTKMYKKKED